MSHAIPRHVLRALLITTSLSTPLAAAAAEAQAQPAEFGPNELEEVVVSAQKRDQSAQDVGIALTALSGEELANRGVQNVTDIVGLTTNVQVNVAAGMNSFNVRGMGSNDFSTNFGSPVAVHVDEVYMSKVFMTSLLLFDIDRFEGLKGPQGTLFGRNTTGGAMNFYTRKPTDSLEANANIGYGNYDTMRGELGIGGPIAGNLTGRIAAFAVDQGEGFYRNLVVDQRDGAERKHAFRGQLAWANDSTDILLSAHYGKDKSLMGGYELLGVYTPDSVAAGTPALCPEYLNGTFSGATANCVRLDGANEGDNDPYTLNASQFIHKQDNTSVGGLLKIEHELAASTLTSVTGIEKFSRKLRESDSASLGVSWRSDTRSVSEELRLSSSGDRTWNYVLGAYFADDKFDSKDNLLLGPRPTDGSTNAYSGAIYSPFVQKSRVVAAFFHNEIEAADELSFIAGVRWTRERVTIDGATYLGDGITPAVPTAINGYPQTILATLATSADVSDGGRRTDEDVSFKTGVQWTPTIESDAINELMIYGNVSTGFRSGGYNAEFVTAQSAFTSLAPEKIVAYEVGFKSTLWARQLQLNGAVFRYDFRDGFINVDVPGAALPITANAAKTETWGSELDLQWLPVVGLNLSASAGWIDSKIKGGLTSGGVSLDGNRPVNTAEWTYNARAHYEHTITAALSAFIAAEGSYRSAQYLEVANEPSSRQEGYWLVNAQLGIEDPKRGWIVTGWVKNLGNSEYRTYVNDLPGLGFQLNIYGAPRTYGVNVSVAF